MYQRLNNHFRFYSQGVVKKTNIEAHTLDLTIISPVTERIARDNSLSIPRAARSQPFGQDDWVLSIW